MTLIPLGHAGMEENGEGRLGALLFLDEADNSSLDKHLGPGLRIQHEGREGGLSKSYLDYKGCLFL